MQLTMPAISVIIPTFNRPRELANCLAAFERSNYPADQFEIIVVDDGSVVSPESTLALINKRLDVKLIYHGMPAQVPRGTQERESFRPHSGFYR